MNKDWKKISINLNATIFDALEKMDELDRKLLMVLNNDKYYGIVSVGDIQRAILNKKDLKTKIKDILRKNLKIAKETDNRDDIVKLMREYRIEFMPVLNNKNELVNIIFWEDVVKNQSVHSLIKFDKKVVIMAGGKGTRLKPITNIIPKALIPIGEKPMIQLVMETFINQGKSEFFISLNYKKKLIENYFNDLKNENFKINYFTEEFPMGTVGSLSLIKNKLKETFFLCNCDTIINQDYYEILKYHNNSKNDLTIVSAIKNLKIPYGTLVTTTNGRLKKLTEKPSLQFQINTGFYILEPGILKLIPENKYCDITDLIEKAVKKNKKVGVFPVSEGSWLDVGEWNKYYEANEKLGIKFN